MTSTKGVDLLIFDLSILVFSAASTPTGIHSFLVIIRGNYVLIFDLSGHSPDAVVVVNQEGQVVVRRAEHINFDRSKIKL